MIPKSNKFPTRIQFLNFRARATQTTTPHLRLMVEVRKPGDANGILGPRLSVIVPVKVNKRAVVRNSLKRTVYDTAWKMIGSKNIDCIILFKPIALLKGKPSEEIIISELKTISFDF